MRAFLFANAERAVMLAMMRRRPGARPFRACESEPPDLWRHLDLLSGGLAAAQPEKDRS
jgi:hypothetical protein